MNKYSLYNEHIHMQFVGHLHDSIWILCRHKVVRQKVKKNIYNKILELLDAFLNCFDEPGLNFVFKAIMRGSIC